VRALASVRSRAIQLIRKARGVLELESASRMRRIAPFQFYAFSLLSALAVNGAQAQTYPSKPPRLVTAGVGSAGDVAARVFAQGISPGLGQAVVVDNRSSGVIPVEVVAKATPDGYTLLFYGNVIWLAPFLYDNVSYDPARDFVPITLVATSPNVLVVHPSVPAKSVKELIALAKARPGQLNYASGGSGSSSHLAGALFNAMANVNIVRVYYKAAGGAMIDVIEGQVQMTFGTAPSLAPHAKSGRLRALAMTGANASPLFPGLPTVSESGLPGYEAGSMYSLLAPAKTPDAVIQRLNQEAVRFVTSTEGKDKYMNVGIETAGSSPQQLAAAIKNEMTRMGKVIRDQGIKGE
jgi:tripartite-type tricarboxylate transporter receptor subunit TctC